MKQNKFILVGNGPYENHGCEALLRGTVDIVSRYYNNTYFIAASFMNNETYNSQKTKEFDNAIEHIRMLFPIKYSLEWFMYKIFKLIHSKNLAYKMCNVMDSYIKDSKAVLSIGGDNYSLDYGNLDWFLNINNYVLSKNKPLILWGVSVGPFSKDKQYENFMKEHLKKVTAIFAREPMTIEYLDSIGVRDNVYRVCDPAFLLEAKKAKDFKIIKESIGMNISPIMERCVCEKVVKDFIELSVAIIEKLIKETGKTIYLIPHVVIKGNSDYVVMKSILDKVDDSLKTKVILIEDKYNAGEYKWIISQMEVFFGARTHATIAALSTLVPTLSFVYSMKSVGINKDLFGNDDFCIYPEQFNEDLFVEKIKFLLNNKEKIKSQLRVRVDESKKLALKAGEYLHNIIK